MFVNQTGNKIEQQELDSYVNYAYEKYGAALEGIDINVIDDDVELTYHLKSQPFERIRRITGYLVGSLDKWNNAKRAEERDRLKHLV